MRLITWNCHHGEIGNRLALLKKYNSDLVFLQEVKAPSVSGPHVRWFGTNQNKGHAIITSGDYSVSVLDEDTIDPFVVPLIVNGRQSFHVLMVWTQKRGEYIRELEQPLRRYHDFLLDKPSVIIGDFNSNAIWDKNHRNFNHSKMVSLLDETFGLKSAYHDKTGYHQGAERHPTLYHCYKPDRRYHIDYCFVPKNWVTTDVIVGEYSDWIEHSDHCPLIVDLISDGGYTQSGENHVEKGAPPRLLQKNLGDSFG